MKLLFLTFISYVYGKNLPARVLDGKNLPVRQGPQGSYLPPPPRPYPPVPPVPPQPPITPPIIPPLCFKDYIVHNTPVMWSSAVEICKYVDAGSLARVNSREEAEYLRTQFGSLGGIWLGASNRADGLWRWTSGEYLSYTDWLPGQPDRQTNDPACLQMNFGQPGKWDDADCKGNKPFVCETQICAPSASFLRLSNATTSNESIPPTSFDPATHSRPLPVPKPGFRDEVAFRAKLFRFIASMSKSDGGCRELPVLDSDGEWVCNHGRHRWICILQCRLGIARGKGVILCVNGSWHPSGDNSCH